MMVSHDTPEHGGHEQWGHNESLCPHCMSRGAFSLVELSIVLVILGLLTGGILAGQSLIHASELRSITTEYTNIVTATQNFKDKYFALPGDIPNATQFWQKQGGLGGYAATCNSNSGAGFNAATQQGGCDGNGDGVVLNNRTTLTTDESAQYWQHLKMSGLIQFKYANSSGDGGIGINFNGPMSSPLSRYPNGLWSIFRNDVDWAWWRTSTTLLGNPATVLAFGTAEGVTNPTTGRLMVPQDAWNIDSKIDDGHASRGKVQAPYIDGAGGEPCRQGGTYTSNSYDLAGAAISCSLVFINPF